MQTVFLFIMSDEEIILLVDYETICRLCLQSNGTLSDLFAGRKDEKNSITLQIADITSVKIIENDGLPMKICHRCRFCVESAYDLRCTAIKSDKLLSVATSLADDNVVTKFEDVVINESVTAEPTDIEAIDRLDKKICTKILRENKISLVHNDDDAESICGSAYYDEQNVDRENILESRVNPDKKDTTIICDSKKYQYRTQQRRGELLRLSKKQKKLKHLDCQICTMKFKSVSEVKSHAVRDHYKNSGLSPYFYAEKPFKCELCLEEFPWRKNLICHQRQHLGVVPFKCDTCGSSFRTKQHLSYHMVIHLDRRHICDSCGAAFRRMFELTQHMMRHEDEEICYPCKSCRVVCSNRISFKAHMKHHELGRRFKCPRSNCPKAYFSQTDLRVHLRSHDNDRCFQCPQCVCSYTSQSQLNRHLKQHTKARVNKCDKCSATFFDYTAYCNHRMIVHGPWHPFKCNACNQGYQNQKHLLTHMAKCTVIPALRTADGDTENDGENMQLEMERSKPSKGDIKITGNVVQPTIDTTKTSFLIQQEDGTIIPTGLFYLKSAENDDDDEEQEDGGTWYTIVEENETTKLIKM